MTRPSGAVDWAGCCWLATTDWLDCWPALTTGVALGATGTATGAPGLWVYCSVAGDGAPPGGGCPAADTTAPLPRNVDIGGSDAADVTAEPSNGCDWASPFGDIEGYA